MVLATTEATTNRKPGLEVTQRLAAQGEGRRRGEERPGSLISPPNPPKGFPSWNILGSGGSSVLPPKEIKFLRAGCYTGNTGSKPGPNSPPHTL